VQVIVDQLELGDQNFLFLIHYVLLLALVVFLDSVCIDFVKGRL